MFVTRVLLLTFVAAHVRCVRRNPISISLDRVNEYYKNDYTRPPHSVFWGCDFDFTTCLWTTVFMDYSKMNTDFSKMNDKCEWITDYVNDCKNLAGAKCPATVKRRASEIFKAWKSLCQHDKQQIITDNSDCLKTNEEIVRHKEKNCPVVSENSTDSDLKDYRRCMLQTMKDCCPEVCPVYDLFITDIKTAWYFLERGKDLPNKTSDICGTVQTGLCFVPTQSVFPGCRRELPKCLEELSPTNLTFLNAKCRWATTEYINDCENIIGAECSATVNGRASVIFDAWISLCQHNNQQIITDNFDCLKTNEETLSQRENNCTFRFTNNEESDLEVYRRCKLQPMKDCCSKVCDVYDQYITYSLMAWHFLESDRDLPRTSDMCGTLQEGSCTQP